MTYWGLRTQKDHQDRDEERELIEADEAQQREREALLLENLRLKITNESLMRELEQWRSQAKTMSAGRDVNVIENSGSIGQTLAGSEGTQTKSA